jgi:hypothetical protein
MLEERGFSTVAIASVRAQAEKTRPPRALWTTSQLGRPLGEPGDAGFQRRVLLAALRLLERTDGPVLLEDFNEDPPGWRDTPGWHPPALANPTVSPETPNAWATAFGKELSARHCHGNFGLTSGDRGMPTQRGSSCVSGAGLPMPNVKTDRPDRAVCIGCQEMAARMEVTMDEGVSRKGDVNSPLDCSESGFADARHPEATVGSPRRSSSACRSRSPAVHSADLSVGA